MDGEQSGRAWQMVIIFACLRKTTSLAEGIYIVPACFDVCRSSFRVRTVGVIFARIMQSLYTSERSPINNLF
jgi:hypothetical protein